MMAKRYFKDEKHEKSYHNFRKMVKAAEHSAEYDSAIYLLAATGKPISANVFSSGIDFRELFVDATVWSSGEKALLRLAASIFGAGTPGSADVASIFYHLDEGNCRVAIQALEIRYLGVR